MSEPVIVPVQLEVTDIDMSGANFADAEKQISKSLSGIKQSIQDAFSGIDTSAINKPIEKSMTSVKKSMRTAEDAYLRYRESIIKAGKSTEEYKSAVSEANAAIRGQESLINDLSQLGPAAAPHLEAARKELDSLIEARNKINPVDFVDNAQPIELEKIANAYKKVLSATENVTKQSEKFNQTAKDNTLTDEYSEMVRQAEAYKKKLEDINDKSKRMETLGATDKQWEALRYNTEQVSSAMDGVIKKMREAVKTGKAFRFGEGNKGELSRQINSLSMSAGNRAGNINKRAMENQSPYTEDYQKSLDELDKLEKKIEAIREKSAKMVELGASKKQFESLAYDAENLDVKVDEAKNHIMNMVNEGKAFKFGGDANAEISKIRDKAGSLQSTLTGVATNAKKAQGGLTALGTAHPKLAAILTVASKIAVGFGKVMQVAGKVGKVIATGFSGAVKVISKVGSAVGKVASGFANLGKRIFSSIKNMSLFGKSGHKTTNDMNTRFKKLSRNILMFGLGFRTAYYAVKRLRTVFVESFKVMGDQFDEVGQPLMRMTESFNRLKGSLATAFQPLVSVVMPILTRFMDYLSGVLEGIGKFMATLTGQGHIYKAVAKDINSVSGAAKDANKQLASYDKLEVINKDNNNTGVDYEKQTIGETESAASSFAEMVKKAWEKADFTSVGVYVTEKLLGVLDTVEKNIIPKVTNLVNKVLKSVNTFLTGFDATAIGDKIGSIVNTLVNGIDWAQLGALFANLNNTVWGFLDGLVNGIEWANLGQSIATGITSMFETIDFNKWVGMISGLANGITTAILNMLTGVDWASIAVKLGDAVNNLFASVDLAKIGTTVNTLFSTIFGLIENFFATVDFGQIASSLAQGINNIFSIDSGTFSNAATNVANGLVTFTTTLVSNIDWSTIGNTLLEGIKTLFTSLGDAMAGSDIDLVSTLGESLNNLVPILDDLSTLMQSVFAGSLSLITTLLAPITEILSLASSLITPLLEALNSVLMPILETLSAILLPIIHDLLSALQPLFDALIRIVLPVINRAMQALMPLIQGVLNLVTAILAPIMELIGPLLEIVFYILDPVIMILAPILDILGTLCNLIASVLRPVLEMILPVLQLLSSVFEILGPLISILLTPIEMIAKAFKFAAGIITGILTPALEVVKFVVGTVTNALKTLVNFITVAFSTIKGFFNQLGKIISIPLNAITGGIEWVANAVIKGLNFMIKAMNKLSFEAPDWLPGIGGKKFGFNIKEIREIKIPRLAQGAVIPPNKEFLAMLGDQKHGTNIEAPLETIKQALAEVLAEVGGGSREPIILQVNGRVLAKVVWDEQEKRYKQTGKYSPA